MIRANVGDVKKLRAMFEQVKEEFGRLMFLFQMQHLVFYVLLWN